MYFSLRSNIMNNWQSVFFFFIIIIYHNLQVMIKQDSYTKANESGEEAQKETMGHIDIGLPQSKK